MTRTRLAVIGSPIAHSKSPRLHAAAYRVLGLPWTYESVEVATSTLADFVATRGTDWRGLSLTMPLKHDIVPLLGDVDATTALTGVANTVLFTDEGLSGFNTDVAGLMQPLVDVGVEHPSHVLVLGAGATAGSAVAAAVRLGADRITVAARNAEKAAVLSELAAQQGANIQVVQLGEVHEIRADVVVNTLPGGAADALPFSREQRQASILFDIIYDPWPTALASSWTDVGGRVIAGIEMLLAQALRQVRIFVGGDPDAVLENENAVVSAMRASVGLGPTR